MKPLSCWLIARLLAGCSAPFPAGSEGRATSCEQERYKPERETFHASIIEESGGVSTSAAGAVKEALHACVRGGIPFLAAVSEDIHVSRGPFGLALGKAPGQFEPLMKGRRFCPSKS